MQLSIKLKVMIAGLLLSVVSGLAFAGTSAYTGTSADVQTAVTLNDNGQVFGYTDSSGYPYVTDYYLTGNNGTGSTFLGSYDSTSGLNDPLANVSPTGNGANVMAMTLPSGASANSAAFDASAPHTQTAISLANPTALENSGVQVLNSPMGGTSGLWLANNGTMLAAGGLNTGAYYAPNDIYAPEIATIYDPSNGTVTWLQNTSSARGLSDNGAYVAFEQAYPSTTVYSAIYSIANNTTTIIQDGGLQDTISGVNNTGQATGYVLNPVTYYSNAYRTGADGSSVQLFGTANGVSSDGLAVNDNGQIGGFITLASHQTEAFITTARGGLLVGLGAGAPTDSTQVDFLNNNGQAIIYDSTTSIYYLYSAGYVVPVSSVTGAPEIASSNGCAQNCVAGLNNNGQILLSDPTLYSLTSASALSASAMASYSNSTLISTTSTFQAVSTAQGGATPTSTFYSDPAASTSTISTSSLQTGVPEPDTLGLLALAAFAMLIVRKRNLSLS